MPWHIVVDDVVDPTPYKDSRAFTAALQAGAKAGKYREGADIRVQQVPEVHDCMKDHTEEARARHSDQQHDVFGQRPWREPRAEQIEGAVIKPVFVYERRMDHNWVMSAAVCVGVGIGFAARCLV